jgi:predicted amidohydrolase
MKFEDVVACCTVNPARVVGWQDRIGSLEVGRDADIAVLRIVDEPINLRDSVGGELTYDKRIAAKWTIRAGELFQGAG